MAEIEPEAVDRGGDGLLLATWVLACGPIAAFLFDFAPSPYKMPPGIYGAFPLATVACTLAATYRTTNIRTKLWCWAGFAWSLLTSSYVRGFSI